MLEDESQLLSPNTQRYGISVLLDVADLFFQLRDRMPISYVATFLRVAATQGLTVSELAARRSVSGAVMSRHLSELGSHNRKGGVGLGLVAVVQRIYGDRREHRVVLTEKGIELAHRVHASARGGGPWAQRLRK